MASIFTRIINGEIPCYKVAEDERFFAFLDIRPLSKGHTLVIPKQETDYLFDLQPELLGGLMQFAQKVAHALKQSVICKRIGVVVIGLEVPHAHIHLIPMNSEADINFSRPKLELSAEEFITLANQIRSNF
ncbi:MAG: HIT domain-containing protein [Bacteroidales bacterium]|nr:HIT domain-containing protein [Bacteroidales bacterium]MCL2132787.1 HIT domain-containing protein [Bacteroidales bacterium]